MSSRMNMASAGVNASSRTGRLAAGDARFWMLGVCMLAGLSGCGAPEPKNSAAPSEGSPTAVTNPAESSPRGASEFSPESTVPNPDMTDMESQVAKRLNETRAAVIANPESADAWGRFGMVAHAHELWEEAEVAYRQAQQLNLTDVRWPYFLADVMSVVGTDLEGAAKAFRRALDLNPDYAPAHLRLGKVLVAANQPAEAARELRRALEIEPGLQPARVALAQIELANGQFKTSEGLLKSVLKEQSRHAQALSTLGQVYMRLGRRDEAREIAARARDAAIYNLYSDPLMGQVVTEGASSVLVWERAKAFLDNGDFEQASRGLEIVAGLLPDNPDVHSQLATAYGNLDRPGRSQSHLERVIALDPGRVKPRVQLAGLLIDYQKPEAAIPHLKQALDLDPDEADGSWLLGRAMVLVGDLRAGLEMFEQAEAKALAAGSEIPTWVHNEWGSALAQTGQPHHALDHFEIALNTDPFNPQSLFYAGLMYESTGRQEEALDHYCRSMKAQPNPLAGGRLQALAATCP